MTYINHLKELTEHLAAFIMEATGNTTITTPAFEEIREKMSNVIRIGIEVFCSGSSPSGLRYEVKIIEDSVNKPVIFEQWSVSDIREHIREDGWTSEDLPTLFKIDDYQLRELLEHFVRKGYSFYSQIEGLMIDQLEEYAEDYFTE